MWWLISSPWSSHSNWCASLWTRWCASSLEKHGGKLLDRICRLSNLVEPCWYSLFNAEKQCIAQILVEVDDFIIAATPKLYEYLRSKFTKRFHVGKWECKLECDEAEYAGHHIQCSEDCIYIDQSKYIVEQIGSIQLSQGRRQNKNSRLQTDEFNSLRSLVFKFHLAWPRDKARSCRFGIYHGQQTVEDTAIANKSVNYLRCTADRALKLWKFNPENVVFIAISDAGASTQRPLTWLTEKDSLQMLLY